MQREGCSFCVLNVDKKNINININISFNIDININNIVLNFLKINK